MPATNAMRDFMAASSIGEAVTPFDNAHAYIGVGDSTAAFAKTQTDLQATTNKLRKPMNSTYPSRSGNVVTYQATFLESEAVFDWNEWMVANGSSGGVMQQRLVQALGTKPNTEQWRLTATLTWGV